jgi:hypothetical protein
MIDFTLDMRLKQLREKVRQFVDTVVPEKLGGMELDGRQTAVVLEVQICGASGISEDTPLSHFYREARPFRIYDGPSEVHRGSIARQILGKAAQA